MKIMLNLVHGTERQKKTKTAPGPGWGLRPQTPV